MKKSTYSHKSKSITKTYTLNEARQIMLDLFRESSDPESIFRDFADNLLPRLIYGTPKESEEAKRWVLGKSEEAKMTMGLETHYPLLDVVDPRYAALLLTITRQVEADYNCTTAVEKLLAENIAVAHVKIIDQSRRLNDLLGSIGYSDKRHVTAAVEVLSRQIDRATRQLYTALTTLRQVKHPQLAVNIVNRTTFVAENQQINTPSL